MRPCIDKYVRISRRSRRRSAVRRSKCFRPRSRAATATGNFSSARAVAERLVIDHVGHRGDGVAFAGGHAVFVPYTIGGETVETGPVADHPDCRITLRVDTLSLERLAQLCRYFSDRRGYA